MVYSGGGLAILPGGDPALLLAIEVVYGTNP